MIRTAALIAALTLVACSDDAEQAAPTDAAVIEDTGFGGDVAAATRQAAADVEAAAREARGMDAPVAQRPVPEPLPEAPAAVEPAADAPAGETE